MPWYLMVLSSTGLFVLLVLAVGGGLFVVTLRMRPNETAAELAEGWRTLLAGLAEVVLARPLLFVRRRHSVEPTTGTARMRSAR